MCGIIGLISRTPSGLFSKDLELFEQMLVINTIRGKDSTGAFTLFRNKQVRAIKLASHPFHLFRAAEWMTFRQDAINRGRFVIGHNRAATRGGVKNENAHPFVENNIILVHNGTLWDDGASVTKQEVEVDSHAIAHALAERDAKEVLPDINGAFALIWYDTKKEKLYATRNKDRPLHILVTEQNFVLSSEHWIAGMPMKRQDRKITDMIEMQPGELYSWNSSGVMEKETINMTPLRPDKHTTPQSGVFDWRAAGWEGDDEDCCLPGGANAPFAGGRAETPEEITRLRNALTAEAQAKAVKNETPHSGSCVLTRTNAGTESEKPTTLAGPIPEATIQTPFNDKSEEDRAWVNMNALRVDLPDFPKGTRLLLKIISTAPLSTNGRIRYTGKIREPGRELVDCVGYLPKEVHIHEIKEWIENLCFADVMFCTQTVSGVSLFMKNIRQSTMTPVADGQEVPLLLWQHAQSTCMCDGCKRRVAPWEKYFTSVKQKQLMIKTNHGNPLNIVSILCADCRIDRVQDADIREVMKARYNNASKANTKRLEGGSEAASANCDDSLSDGFPIREGIGNKDDRTPAVQSTKTLQ